MAWQGDFENQQRAEKRLAQVVPISLLLIFLLLFIMFGNFKDSALVFLNVPFAIVGGLLALHITGTNFSISAGIGFIALFGICIQDGVLLITVFKQNLEKMKGQHQSLYSSMLLGVRSRIRPVMMTALMAAIGLFPAAISHGIGSESSRPLARVVIGGILCAMVALFADNLRMTRRMLDLVAFAAVVCFGISGSLILRALRRQVQPPQPSEAE